MKKLLVGCALSALAASSAYAQSTGSVDFQQKDIVITGTRTKSVDGVQVPNTAKAKGVLDSTFIQRQTPGQSVDDIINMLPGVSFQNNDPYGASGGTLTIRGFDASRISQTFDGIPLNDTGNYALYSNQQLDPELIDQVSVNLGTTDVDSPTASATGSTVNYRTRDPYNDFHVRLQGSAGSFDFFRIFAVVDTGVFTPFGTKAFLSFSHEENENPYQALSRTDKWQYNGKIYQPIGSSGDFISAAFNWNHNVNGNFSSVPLRIDPVVRSGATVTGPRVVGSGSSNRFPLTHSEADYTALVAASCAPSASAPGGGIDMPQTGVADSTNTCGTLFDQSFNPSNTGNIRVNSRFTLANGLVLTVDPSYQYVKANGGSGAVKGNEGFYTRAAGSTGAAITTPIYGYIGGQPYFGGVDLNGDGDVLDSPGHAATGALTGTTQGVEGYASSQTGTHRIGVISSLRYDISSTQTIRLSYSYDHGRHRQTGAWVPLNRDGSTSQYFPIDAPVSDASGAPIEKRNRLSYAILNQVSGEYSGRFFEKLVITAGVRAPFYERKLNNYCVTEAGGSFVDCFNNAASQAAFLAASPTFVAPISKTFKYHKILPQAGATYDITSAISAYASYSKGLQVPGTDNLYQSLGFPNGSANPAPETTNNFDTGLRYRTSKIQAQLGLWYTGFQNRLASAYDPVNDVTVYRNLGTVHKYGVDGNVAYTVIPEVTVMAFGSYLKSKILNNVDAGTCTAANAVANACTVGQPIFALTAGKRESGAPVYTAGGRIEGNLGPLEVGLQAKRTGRRYINDQNLPVVQCTGSVQVLGCTGTPYQVYGAIAKGYTTVDLDARLAIGQWVHNDRTYIQFNVTNLFNKLYVAGYTGSYSQWTIPFAYVGAPRAISGTLVVGF
ncbi:MAG TPA: TonB-dependent receptor [Sphingomonas sp.]|uniref:TonB-dependent receptor n=1 Tax=Sphingomonas sp. TaxID=28214 RepID=UPI002C3FCE27|nr:TonB-dependent receptor [Sphingomonas sp.]HMI19270.1 TonB-dependent receptor [Sphingomonas sp.]